MARRARGWWAHRGLLTLRLACGAAAILALLKLGTEFYRLVWDGGPSGAIDLRILHELTRRWFAGAPIYDELGTAVHPPATYAILWPLLGWLTLPQARWLWALTLVGILAALTILVIAQSGAEEPAERAFAALMPLCLNATGVTVGNGQLTIHLVTLLLLVVLSQGQRRNGIGKSLVLSTAVVFTLVKPTVSLPFLWLILFGRGGAGIALLVALGYSGLTALSASFQQAGLPLLLGKWLARGSDLALRGGYANLHIWAGALGLEQWLLPLSLAVLLALGMWVYAHRRRDTWLLLGVTALVARFWTYHRLYDDMLVLLPMVTLFRIAKQGPRDDWCDVGAGALLGATLLVMVLPARLRYAPWPWHLAFTASHALVWAVVLIFLLYQAERGHAEA